MTSDARDSMELRLALRRLEAAEAALADARRSLADILERKPSAPPTPEPAPVRAPVSPYRPLHTRTEDPSRPPKPRKPPLSTEAKLIRAVAVIGSLITVAGVGLAIALAIQAGLLGPLGRVLLAVLLAVALFSAGLWLDQQRRGGTGPGVTALFVTSWLVSGITVVALVDPLFWWPRWAAVLALVAVWLLLAVVSGRRNLRWVPFFMGLTLPLAGLPLFLLSSPVTWLVLLLPLTLLALPFGERQGPLRIAAGISMVLLMLWVIDDLQYHSRQPALLAAVLVALIAALLFAAVTLRTPAPDERVNIFTVFAVPVVLLLLVPVMAAESLTIWLLVPATVALATLGYRHGHVLGVTGVCATAVAFVFVWELSPPLGAGALIDSTIAVVAFFVAAIIAVIWLDTQEETNVWPWATWLAAALVITFALSRSVLNKSPLWLIDHVAVLQAALITVFLGVVLTRRRILGRLPGWVQVALAVAGLHLSMVAVVTAATWLGNAVAGATGMWLGYLIGHAVVSVLWMVLAAWILLVAPGLSDAVSLRAGMILALAGVIKLVFFDLGTLEGLPRALAFLISGIALLAIAALRTRRRPAGLEEQQWDQHEQRAEHQ